VELTTIAKTTELAGKTVATATEIPTKAPTETPIPSLTPSPSPTPCTAIITANTSTEIRSEPDTASGAIGTLPVGGTAKLAGRNDANTWWYIEFSGGAGGHAWVSGTAVTASCLPSVVQIVTVPTPSILKPRTSVGASLSIADVSLPDLVATEMRWVPTQPKKNQTFTIWVKVSNIGTEPADEFVVEWWADRDANEPACSWIISELKTATSVFLDCQHTYTSDDYPDTDSFWVTMLVDTEHEVTEKNESKDSNSRYAKLLLLQK
jgi:hypothetical protein